MSTPDEISKIRSTAKSEAYELGRADEQRLNSGLREKITQLKATIGRLQNTRATERERLHTLVGLDTREMEDRLAAATARPWRLVHQAHADRVYEVQWIETTGGEKLCSLAPYHEADADFLVHAAADMDLLLADLRLLTITLRATVAALGPDEGGDDGQRSDSKD